MQDLAKSLPMTFFHLCRLVVESPVNNIFGNPHFHLYNLIRNHENRDFPIPLNVILSIDTLYYQMTCIHVSCKSDHLKIVIETWNMRITFSVLYEEDISLIFCQLFFTLCSLKVE